MNFRRRGLVWKSVAIFFFFLVQKSSCAWDTDKQCHESWTGLSRKSYSVFALQVFPKKRQLDVKIAVWSPWFYQIVRETTLLLLLLQQRQQRRLAIMTSKLSKWNNSLREISVNHCWKCNKTVLFNYILVHKVIYYTIAVMWCTIMLVAFVESVFVYYPSFFWCLGRDVIRDGHFLGTSLHLYYYVSYAWCLSEINQLYSTVKNLKHSW